MSLLGSYFHQKQRHSIIPLRLALLNNVFLQALEVRIIDRKPEVYFIVMSTSRLQNFENVAETEKVIFGTFLKMADVLTDSELRPMLSGLVEWAEPALSLKEQYKPIRIRLVTLYNFANQ